MDLERRVYTLEKDLARLPLILAEDRQAFAKFVERFDMLSHIVARIVQIEGINIIYGPIITKGTGGHESGSITHTGEVPPSTAGLVNPILPQVPGLKSGPNGSGHYV